ncbi:GGDEF domain-containing protein [Thiomicrospira pelophila]|uniref:GGDEF domain-containing protein n=1 Tax=Thiomicrospira pelophila TaxID=934 RepID=UPI0004A6CFBC|nr:GGDEF domain-containing protein [Thiomicrospira pelophila]
MKRTEQTLLEQMKMSDVEISHRMNLLSLTSEELSLLHGHKSIIEDNIDVIVDEFYEKQTEIDEISLLIGDADTLMRLRAAQRKYVMDLFSGSYDSEYVNNRLRIGMVHKRIGVEPKLYLSAVRTLKEMIIKTLKRIISDKDLYDRTIDALEKLLYFDTTLVFDTYIDSLVGEIENAKNRTEIYAKSLEEKVAERTLQLEEQAQLDPLTNLYNQRVMQELLSRDLATSKRRQVKLSLVYFDIDQFKNINDTHGHLKGDDVLKSIGKAMLNNVRSTDIACRYGGDEFCIILPDCGADEAKVICKKIMNEFNEKYPDYSFSVGIAETGLDEYIDGDQLIKIADDKMYQAKKDGGFQVRT